MFGMTPKVPDWLEMGMSQNIDPSMMQTGSVKPKGGMFGGGLGSALGSIAGTMGDYFLQRSGMQPMYGPQMAQQRMLKMQEEQYQRQRQDSMADWQAKQQWTLDHAQPEQTSYARDLIAAGIMPGTPKFNQLYGQYVQQKAQTGGSLLGNLFKDPATGQQYMPANLPPLGEEMDDPRKQGGPTPQASGGFPPFGY